MNLKLSVDGMGAQAGGKNCSSFIGASGLNEPIDSVPLLEESWETAVADAPAPLQPTHPARAGAHQWRHAP